ncbi:MAG: hypothetical protein I4N50_11000, partial [Rhizobium sp.]|nr:hypothetical protein [Rhizobium sp.]
VTDDAISWSALPRSFWIPLEVCCNWVVTAESALTALACNDALLGVLASDDNADWNAAIVLASEVPVVELSPPEALP